MKKFPCATFCGAVGCEAVGVAGAFCCGGAVGVACACNEGAQHGSKTIVRIVAATPGHADGFCEFIEPWFPLLLKGYSQTHKELIKVPIIFVHRSSPVFWMRGGWHGLARSTHFEAAGMPRGRTKRFEGAEFFQRITSASAAIWRKLPQTLAARCNDSL